MEKNIDIPITVPSLINNNLLRDIKDLINQTKYSLATRINSEMTILYWNIGKKINQEVLKEKRAEYGRDIINSLSTSLATEYGKTFSRVSLNRMIQFYEHFQDFEICSTLSSKLSWSCIIELLPLKESKQREFYAYMCIQEGWSVRNLRSNIHKMTYERSAIAKKEVSISLLEASNNNILSPDMVLKDPYILDFLELPDEHYESDLENAILQKIEKFILELGTGFSFVARQKRMTIGNEQFYLDLLFYNRKLKRLVAIELKTGKFKAEYKGQMELYLNWLKKYETFEGENPAIGIILCSEKSNAQIELLDLSSSGIHVAEYWTELPPLEIFKKKVQEIVFEAKSLYEKQKMLIEEK